MYNVKINVEICFRHNAHTCMSDWDCLQKGISSGYSRTCPLDAIYGCFVRKINLQHLKLYIDGPSWHTYFSLNTLTLSSIKLRPYQLNILYFVKAKHFVSFFFLSNLADYCRYTVLEFRKNCFFLVVFLFLGALKCIIMQIDFMS